MNAQPAAVSYVLGSTDAEHERLIRQAARLEPLTERLFRDAGVAAGQRVLDLGSGVGDVALLAARLVGPTGRVVGVDRDARALGKARERAARAGMAHLTFLESDVAAVMSDVPFDAVVGRFVLQFVDDPVAVLRHLTGLVRPGGVVVFHEPNWAGLLAQTAHLPLRSAVANLIIEAFRRAGARTDMDRVLFRGFQQAGLRSPQLRLELPVGDDAETRRWLYDLYRTVHPRVVGYGLPTTAIGSVETLAQRLDAELDEQRAFAACIALVGAWSRRAAD